MTPADRLVLDALHQEARNWLTPAQWQEVENEVAKAGGVVHTTGYARTIIEKAARQSFGGNRSAAGAYAANIRWQRAKGGDAKSGTGGGTATAGGSTGGGEDEEFDGTHATAMKEGQKARDAIGLTTTSRGVTTGNAAQRTAKEHFNSAHDSLRESEKNEKAGDKMGAWMRAEEAHGFIDQILDLPLGAAALDAFGRFKGATKALVGRLTDKFYE